MAIINFNRLLAMADKEARQLRRDRRSLVLAFLLPVMLLVIFGYAISWDVRDIRTVVLDNDNSRHSRALLDAFRASGYFILRRNLSNYKEIDTRFDGVNTQLAILIPADFSEKLNTGKPAEVQAIVDGSDANTATIILSYTRAITQSYALDTLLRGREAHQPVRLESRVWYNEELLSKNMIVPGLVAVIMMIVAAMLTSLTIAREWERGTMEQLAATPVSRTEVVIGKLLPYLAIGLIDVVVSSMLGVWIFDVPFQGNVLLFMVMSTFFLIGALGLGFIISAVGRSQLMATQVAMIITFLPAFLLSGFMYSISVMPQPLQSFTYLIPARYFIVVTRGIFLKGVGPEALWVQGTLMIIFAAIGLLFSIKAFKKELRA